MKKLLTILFSVLLSSSLYATDYYINRTEGNYRTISDVNNLQGVLKAGDNVFFARGQSFTGTFTPTRNDVHYDVYGTGDQPSLNRWMTPAGWVQVATNVWRSSTISGAPDNLRVVVMNNVMYAKGRSPDAGYYTANSYNGRISNTNPNFAGHNYAGAEIAVRRNHWIIDVNRIGSQSGNTVYYSGDQDGSPVKGNSYGSTPNLWGSFIQNHPDCLNLAGEWYWNRSTKQISIYSLTNPGNTVVISGEASVMNLGTVSGLTFNNIRFEGSNVTGINTSSGSNNITFTDCPIRYMLNGVQTAKSNSIIFNRCNVDYTLNLGIGLQANNGLFTNGRVTYNGHLAGMGNSGDGAYFGARIGASSSVMSNGARFENSEVAYCGYVGVAIGGINTIIQNNYIHDFGFIKDDGGGIYGYNIQKYVHSGRIIRNNIITNGIGAPAGTNTTHRDIYSIYADGGTDHIEIYNNTFAYAGFSGIFLNSANSINIHDNTFYGNHSSGIRYQNYGGSNGWAIYGNIIASNIFAGAKGEGQSGINFTSNPQASWGNANFNHYASDNGKVVSISGTGNLTLAQWRAVRGWDMGASYKAVTTDILFIYNPTGVNKTISFANKTYTDIFGSAYLWGYFTLPPYSSRVLFNTPNISVDPNAPAPPAPPEDPPVETPPGVDPPSPGTEGTRRIKQKFIIINKGAQP